MPKARAKSHNRAHTGGKTAGKIVPWYLSGRDEECPHCGEWYAYELEFRCPECDGPSCPHCKSKHAEDRVVCPSCVVLITEVVSDGG